MPRRLPHSVSHLPLRKWERQMQGFRSPGGLQRFTSVFSVIRNLFVPPARKRPAFSTPFTGSPPSPAGLAPPVSALRPDRSRTRTYGRPTQLTRTTPLPPRRGETFSLNST